MTPAARIQATLDLLDEIETAPRPVDALVSAYFRARRFIGSHDRAAISTRLYSVLRHHYRLQWWAGRLHVEAVPRTLLLIWLALGEKMPARDIDALFSGGKYGAAALSGGERDQIKRLEGGTVEHPEMPELVLAECPPGAEAALRARFGATFLREMRAMQVPAALDLRVNTLKSTREAVIAEFTALGFKPKSTLHSPWGVRLHERPSLGTLALLKDGAIEVQDEGSQLVALALGAKAGERIADFCAGAGGKTLAIGAMMENKGRIDAMDIMETRLKKSAERFRRAGLFNVQSRLLSSERDPWVKRHKGVFDRVLADAPCSGSGTWRRNPDARWRALGPGLDNLVKIQAEILDSAARLVKPGGCLVYATCSLMAEENEKQIAHFIATHAGFTVDACGLNGADFLALTPAQHGTDGFFAARLQRAGPM